ncbi:hypothetical protein BGZ61DRAFT_470254 [Ilyonectria robusta]|uniref:uncharacterized protein n=1 Tax=Ilyonectria robusta TaxID=1079257 RepID=UPI001E8E99D0|nr:uncharacterized protein BGZ61DRAFT_470254 [Ilyonectria robusta]KAH8736728.1 hypothetical protein BGZ61DRAFT_470254 [Ilyonectria robusta]
MGVEIRGRQLEARGRRRVPLPVTAREWAIANSPTHQLTPAAHHHPGSSAARLGCTPGWAEQWRGRRPRSTTLESGVTVQPGSGAVISPGQQKVSLGMHEAILVSLQALLDWGQGDSKWVQGRRGRRSGCGDGKRDGFFVRMGIKHQNLARFVNALHACRVCSRGPEETKSNKKYCMVFFGATSTPVPASKLVGFYFLSFVAVA